MAGRLSVAASAAHHSSITCSILAWSDCAAVWWALARPAHPCRRLLCSPTLWSVATKKRRAKSRRWGSTPTAAVVKRAASTSQSARKDAGSVDKPAESVSRATRNATRSGQVGIDARQTAALAGYTAVKPEIDKRGMKVRIVRGKGVRLNTIAVKGKDELSMTDRVFRPMTRKQAAQVGGVLRSPGLPSTKLPPRP